MHLRRGQTIHVEIALVADHHAALAVKHDQALRHVGEGGVEQNVLVVQILLVRSQLGRALRNPRSDYLLKLLGSPLTPSVIFGRFDRGPRECKKKPAGLRGISHRHWADFSRCDRDNLGTYCKIIERRRIGARHPDLAAEALKMIKQRDAPARVEVSGGPRDSKAEVVFA